MTTSLIAVDLQGIPQGKVRPAQRVRRYLEALAERVPAQSEHRLPGAQQLAQTLHVSQRTVATVYKKMSQEGVLRAQAGDGTYLLGTAGAASQGEFRIGLSVGLRQSRAGSQRWVSEICGGILAEAERITPAALVMPLPGGAESECLAERAQAMISKVDGLILFPSPSASSIREAFTAAEKPVVSLNAPSCDATADFVSPDYYHASRRIGVALRETGRRRLLYLISGPIGRSVSTQQRLAGLAAGVGVELGRGVSIQIARAEGPDESFGYAAIKAHLDTAPAVPDAIYAAGDMLAIGAIHALEEHGLCVPEDVSVIGGTGAQPDEFSHLRLTCCRQPLHDMGGALLDTLISRLQNPGRSTPGRYFATPFVGGGTTREQENRHLELSDPH